MSAATDWANYAHMACFDTIARFGGVVTTVIGRGRDGLPTRVTPLGSVGEERHRDARVAAEEHGGGGGGRSEPGAYVVESVVKGAGRSPLERQRELKGAVDLTH